MPADSVFDNLLVSTPNGGGLYAVRQGEPIRLEARSSTGIALRGSTLLRTLQPAGWVFYGDTAETSRIEPSAIPDIHDVLLTDDGFLAVGTEDNEVIQHGHDFSVTRRWRLDSVQDSMHINSLADWQGRIVFSAFGDFTTHRGYKAGTLEKGFVRDLRTGETRIEGLSQPHSLTPSGEDLLLADSECLSIALYAGNGARKKTATLDAYTRGIAIGERAIFVGLSCSRNINDGAEHFASIVALDPRNWREIGRMSIPAREIYDIRIARDARTLDTVLARIARISPQISPDFA